jgi:hypothetical protein
MRSFLMAAMLMAFALVASAQDLPNDPAPESAQPAQMPEKGMAPWAFWLAEGSEIAAVGTQEIAFAHFGLYGQFVGKRLASGAATLALPIAVRYVLRKAPRADANVEGVIIAAYALFGTSQNIRILVTVHPGRR